MMPGNAVAHPGPVSGLRRALRLPDLILYGLVVIQVTAPMPVFGVMTQRAHGHAVLVVLLAMVAMLFTAVSYGRMANAYPSAGSAFTYVGQEIHPALGYVTGWCMVMDYAINPILCTILCSKFAQNAFPDVPYHVWTVLFVLLFTGLNLAGVRTSARFNLVLTAVMSAVVVVFLAAAARYLWRQASADSAFFLRPIYDAQRFAATDVLGGTSLAVLTYIGFDGISTLSEEVENPRRNILLATVLVCLITGVLAAVQVYAAQLIWPAGQAFPDVDTAFVHVAGRAGGPWLFGLINYALLAATIGSGVGSLLGAARLLYGMGRANALAPGFFGAVDARHGVPRNNVLCLGAFALFGAWTFTFERAVELLNFGALFAFMGVNLAAFVRYFLRAERRHWFEFVSPVAGFAVSFLLWLNLSAAARLTGSLWLAAGVAYGAIRTRGFRRDLVRFDTWEGV
jgi:amino acid transporter